MRKALQGNFAPIIHKKPKPVKQAPKKFKAKENFVKLNLSKGRSFSKMGKTRYAKKFKNKFKKRNGFLSSIGLEYGQSSTIPDYSLGYQLREKPAYTSHSEILEHDFGFKTWLTGQYETIVSVLERGNSLSVLPTGGGKSLCYQFVARVISKPVLVIVPLISLIHDSINRLPRCLSGAVLHASTMYSTKRQILKDLADGKIDIIYVTPEKFLSDRLYEKDWGLICIDEIQCMCEDNSSYRLVYTEILTYLSSHKLLGLSATVTSESISHICSSLSIASENVIISTNPIHENISVTISKETDIMRAVGNLITDKRFRTGSVIIFSPYQHMADTVAQWLASLGESCAVYHAGLDEQQRRLIQEKFMMNEIRVMVATLSFSLGLDKRDIRGVIHLCQPKSIEQWLQEIGRAGRDMEASYVHVFVDITQFYKLRGMLFSNHVLKSHILACLKKLGCTGLKRELGEDLDEGSSGEGLIELNMKVLCEELGLEKEALHRVFKKLERYNAVKFHGIIPVTALVRFHRTAPEELAEKYSIISHVLSIGRNLAGTRKVNIAKLAYAIDIPPRDTTEILKRLQATGEISCEFTDESFIFERKDVDINVLEVMENIEKELLTLELKKVSKLETCYDIVNSFASAAYAQSSDLRSCLIPLILEYMSGSHQSPPIERNPVTKDITPDLNRILSEFDEVPDAKDIVAVLQGIPTRRISPMRWRDTYIWGRYSKHFFLDLLEIAKEFLMNEMGKKAEYLKRMKTN